MIIYTFNQRSSLYVTVLPFTSLLHFNSIHFTLLHCTSLHFTPRHISKNIKGSTLDFLFSKAPTKFLWPTRSHIQRLQGSIFPGVKRRRKEGNQTPTTIAEVTKKGSVSPVPHIFSWHLERKFYFSVTT